MTYYKQHHAAAGVESAAFTMYGVAEAHSSIFQGPAKLQSCLVLPDS